MYGELKGKITIVTGASRGIGRGIALGLGQMGATVYLTGRSLQEGVSRWPGTLSKTAEEVTSLGGQGIAVQCDHKHDEEVRSLFQRVKREQNQLDLLVNNATSFGETPRSYGYDPEHNPFWELPIEQWDEIIDVGLRSHYVASVFAAPIMIERRRGLIINVSSNGAQRYAGNIGYGVGKAGVDKLSADMAHQLLPFNVASLSIWPPLTKTEKVMAFPEHYPLERAFSPMFTGRVVAKLSSDPKIMEKTGRALTVTDLAQEYGLTDLADTSSLRSQ